MVDLDIIAGTVEQKIEITPGLVKTVYNPFNIRYAKEFLQKVDKQKVLDCIASDVAQIKDEKAQQRPGPAKLRISLLHEIYGLLNLYDLEERDTGKQIDHLLKVHDMEPVGKMYPRTWLDMTGLERFARDRPEGSLFEQARPLAKEYAAAMKQFLMDPRKDSLDKLVFRKEAVSKLMDEVYKFDKLNPEDYIHSITISSYM